jgi:hypothetical protein
MADSGDQPTKHGRVISYQACRPLLTRTTPRPAPPRDVLLRQAAARAAQTRTAGTDRPEPSNHPPNELQQSILTAMRELTRRGHPPNAP